MAGSRSALFLPAMQGRRKSSLPRIEDRNAEPGRVRSCSSAVAAIMPSVIFDRASFTSPSLARRPIRSAMGSLAGSIRSSNQGRNVESSHSCNWARFLPSGSLAIPLQISASEITLKKSWSLLAALSHCRLRCRPRVGQFRRNWCRAGNLTKINPRQGVGKAFEVHLQTFEKEIPRTNRRVLFWAPSGERLEPAPAPSRVEPEPPPR